MYERPIRPNELMHYGVLGMHWGVRKDRQYSGRSGARVMRRLQRKNLRQMKKLARVKKKVDKTKITFLNPVYAIREYKVDYLKDDIKKRTEKINNIALKASGSYVRAGERRYNELMEREYEKALRKVR